MRIYVAAASSEWRRARGFIRSLENLGHEVNHDWTDGIEVNLARGGDSALPTSTRTGIAEECHAAARDCEWFVRLFGPEKSEGAAYEHGVAAAAERFVIVVGHVEHRARTLMAEQADETFDTDVEALTWIGEA